MPSTNIKITATDKSKSAFNSARRNVDALKGSVTLLKGALLSYISISGARAFVNFANQQRDMADALGKTSERLGLSTKSLQELSFGAEKAGIATSTFEMALQRFTRRASEASNGTGEAKDALKQLGITLLDSNGRLRKTEDMLSDVADSFALIPDQGERVRLAFKLFDSEGVKMVNMLQNGSSALDVFKKQIRRTGGVIKDDLIQSSSEANDRLTWMGKIWNALTAKALKPANKAILDVTDSFLKFKGIDPTADMSLRRLREVAEELEVQISKTATKQRNMNNNVLLSKEVREAEAKALGKVIFNLDKEHNLILARIRDAKNLDKEKEKAIVTNEKNKEKEVKNLHQISEAEQEFYASKMTRAFEAHAKEKELAEKQNEISQKIHTAKLTQASEAHAKQQELRAEIIEFRRSEEEQITADIMTEHARRKEIILEYLRGEGVANTEKNALVLANTRDTAEKLKALDIEKRDSAIATSKQMIQTMGSANKSWFDANKALAIAETTMATYTGATKALSIPPPWVGIAYASTITGLGMANVARISNTKYEGRAMGGSVNAGQSYIVGERGQELFTPNQSGKITPNDKLGGTTVNFNISTNDAQGFDTLLQQRRGMIVNMINRAQRETGRGNLI